MYCVPEKTTNRMDAMMPQISILMCHDHLFYRIKYISLYNDVLQHIPQEMHENQVIIYDVCHNKEKWIVNTAK